MGETAIGQGILSGPYDTADQYGLQVPADPTESGGPGGVTLVNDRALRLSPSSEQEPAEGSPAPEDDDGAADCLPSSSAPDLGRAQ